MTRRIGRLLLVMFPARFRRRYGTELLETVAAQSRDSEYSGAIGTARFWAGVVADLGAAAWRLRAGERAKRRQASTLEHVRPFPGRTRRQVDMTLQDLRQALRLFVHRPGFAVPAVITLAIGVGGAALVGGLVDGLVLNPFHYPQPDRLVAIGVSFPRLGGSERFIEVLSPAEFTDLQALRTLDRVMAFDLGNRNISGGDVPERVFTALVFDDPFRTLRMAPRLGRGFTRDELGPGGARVAVLSHRIWQSRFGGDANLVGRSILVNGEPVTVVGIMPANLLLVGTDLWLPLGKSPTEWPRTARQFTVLARLAPGISRGDADAELAALSGRTTAAYRTQHREYEDWRLSATPLAEALTRPMRAAAQLLVGAIAFLLLFVVANVSSLHITRLSTRQRELAVRMALGASRWRITRELFTESLVLTVVGCALGLAVAGVGLRATTALLPNQLTAAGIGAGFSLRILLAGIGLSVAIAVATAVVPATLLGRIASGDSLKSDNRGATPGRRSQRLRQGLVVVELAVALVLLVGAGLMAHTLNRLYRLDPGMDMDRVLTMRLTLPPQKYSEDAITRFFDGLVTRIGGTPGVRSAAAASQYPPNVFFASQFRLQGREAPGDRLPNADVTIATPRLFEVLRVPLRQGRLFTPADRRESPPVAVVNEAFAARYFPGTSALGQRIATGTEGAPQWMEIIGVVGDTRGRGVLASVTPEIYRPMTQDPDRWNQLFLLVRTEGEPRAMLDEVRRAVAAFDRDQPIYGIQTLEAAFAGSILQHRASAILLVVFAGIAVVLAVVGVYAVMSQTVVARTQEIGIRMALGAAGWDVTRMISGLALKLLILGAVLGLAGGLVLGGIASSMLVETSATDPAILLAVTGLLLATGLVAGWVPARRASRVDPSVALRVE